MILVPVRWRAVMYWRLFLLLLRTSQSEERVPHKRRVAGSIPAGATTQPNESESAMTM
jgi:hypothetical protein